MGQPKDQNEELREDRNFEHHDHSEDDNENRDGDGRIIPKAAGKETKRGELFRKNDGGAEGRNNMGDKSGR